MSYVQYETTRSFLIQFILKYLVQEGWLEDELEQSKRLN